jgi:hypothetical protein
MPACGTRPPLRGAVGWIVADRHVVALPADIPPGEYPLQVGLYEPQTVLRMDRLDTVGNAQGTDLTIAAVQVSP